MFMKRMYKHLKYLPIPALIINETRHLSNPKSILLVSYILNKVFDNKEYL